MNTVGSDRTMAVAHMGVVCYLSIAWSNLTHMTCTEQRRAEWWFSLGIGLWITFYFIFYTYFFSTMIISFIIRKKCLKVSRRQAGTWPLQPGWLPASPMEHCHRGGNRAAASLPGRLPGRCTLESSPNR